MVQKFEEMAKDHGVKNHMILNGYHKNLYKIHSDQRFTAMATHYNDFSDTQFKAIGDYFKIVLEVF